MTHLNIQQGLNIEVVSTNLIKKLYEAALSVPEPLEGELDAAYLSGNLLVDKSYRALVEYLTNRFDDLHINVTDTYYIPFEDNAVLNVLLTNNIGSDGIGVTEAEAANATFTNSTFKNNTTITSFNEFPYFTKANTNPPAELFRGCSNLLEIDLSNTTTISNMEFERSGIIDINAPLLTSLIEYAFNGCSLLLTVTDLGAVTEIPIRCFLNSPNLTSVNLPSNTKYIRTLAFGETSLMLLLTINLSNVTHVDEKAFSNCRYLDIDASELSNLISIGSRSFNWCKKIHGELNIPKLQSIGAYSFEGCKKITKVKCLGKIISIPEGFMRKHSEEVPELVEVYLPYECISIGNFAFDNDTDLTTIKQYTLSVDNWIEGETPTYGDITRVISFGSLCFKNCSSLNIPTTALLNAVSIGELAFSNCSSLTGTLNLPSLVSLGNGAFQWTNITNVLNLGQISEIVDPFWNCASITEIVLPTTLRKSSSFPDTHVSKLIYPYGFTEKISGRMCAGELGRYLLYILFPSTVTKIMCNDMYRDSGSSRIRCHIVVLATTPPNTNRNPSDTGAMGLGWGWGDPRNANWYVPDAVVNTYKADVQWSSIADYIFPISQLEKDSHTCWDWYQANKDYGVPAQS